ncbi:MAG: hypothetical protein L0216_12395 [Planctomycetales bacterium]|nr:hypothetical protein [Planctomycetales bacterium]
MGKKMMLAGLAAAGMACAIGCRTPDSAASDARLAVRLPGAGGAASASPAPEGGLRPVGVEFVAEQVRLCGGRIR